MKNLALKTMKYKMIVADFGETMVHTGQSINVNNVNAIKDYQSSGGLFAIATGREFTSINRKVSSNICLSLDDMPLICFYGALVTMSKTEQVIYDKPIPEIDYSKVLKLLDANNIPFSVVTKAKTLTIAKDLKHKLTWKKEEDIMFFQDVKEIINSLKKNKASVYKIDIYKELSVDEIEELYIQGLSLKVYQSRNELLEIISSNASKGIAFERLLEFSKIDKKDALVVGDGPNDCELFDKAINKVAVSNAIEFLKAKSSFIIDNRGYLGIARLIELILKNAD